MNIKWILLITLQLGISSLLYGGASQPRLWRAEIQKFLEHGEAPRGDFKEIKCAQFEVLSKEYIVILNPNRSENLKVQLHFCYFYSKEQNIELEAALTSKELKWIKSCPVEFKDILQVGEERLIRIEGIHNARHHILGSNPAGGGTLAQMEKHYEKIVGYSNWIMKSIADSNPLSKK